MVPAKNPFSRKDLQGRLLELTSPAPWTKLFKKSYIDSLKLEFQVQQNANDAYFVLTAIALADRITYVAENLVFYRIGMQSNLQTKKVKYPCCFLNAYEAVFEKAKATEIYPDIEKGFVNQTLSGYVFNLRTMTDPGIRWMICERMQSSSFCQMHLLDYEDEYYTNVKDKYFLQAILEAYRHSKEKGEQTVTFDETQIVLPEKTKSAEKVGIISEGNAEVVMAEKKQLEKGTAKTGTGMNIKKILRRFIPAGRTYMDKKMKDMEKSLTVQLEKQNKMLEDQKRMLEDQKRMLQFLQKKDEEQMKSIRDVTQYVDQEFRRRDTWEKKSAENQRMAAGRQIWVIKCPAPEDPSRVRWGDYPFALSLKRYLEDLNCYVILDMRQDWDCEEGADVVVALRGNYFYRPDRRNKDCLYIMWNISHPDKVTKEEYELFDVVCVGSRHYAKVLREKLNVPVLPLLQCTDTAIFYPKETPTPPRWEYIFIGNSRGVARNCVMWAVEEKLPIRMWGGNWERILPDHMYLFEDTFIENDQIPELYRSSKVTLNDHWEDMLEKQFVNNRIFDALACGLPVISDVCEELREIFPDAVLYYRNKNEFRECVRQIEENYDEIKEKVLAQWELINEQYSFKARARELVEIAERYKKEK